MTAPRKAAGEPPPSAGVLAKAVRAYVRETGIAEWRVKAWIAYMTLAGILERHAAAGGSRFTVKGGVALELRLRDRARATRDIDLVLHDREADLARALERALADVEYQGFRLRRKGEPLVLDNGAVHLELSVTYRGGAWTSIAVDLARAEVGEEEVELLDAIPVLEPFGFTGPARLSCLPLRWHVAQKLHGMTLPPRPGKRNERFRDLLDLLLLEALITDYAGLRDACASVFRARGTHAWPPPLDVPPHWIEPFADAAQELKMESADIHLAMERIAALVARIQAS